MGDIKKKGLASKIYEREQRREETVHTENKTIDKISGHPCGKNKAISVRINELTYENFKKICEKRGLSSNSCINMLISDFVIENKDILDL